MYVEPTTHAMNRTTGDELAQALKVFCAGVVNEIGAGNMPPPIAAKIGRLHRLAERLAGQPEIERTSQAVLHGPPEREHHWTVAGFTCADWRVAGAALRLLAGKLESAKDAHAGRIRELADLCSTVEWWRTVLRPDPNDPLYRIIEEQMKCCRLALPRGVGPKNERGLPDETTFPARTSEPRPQERTGDPPT